MRKSAAFFPDDPDLPELGDDLTEDSQWPVSLQHGWHYHCEEGHFKLHETHTAFSPFWRSQVYSELSSIIFKCTVSHASIYLWWSATISYGPPQMAFPNWYNNSIVRTSLPLQRAQEPVGKTEVLTSSAQYVINTCVTIWPLTASHCVTGLFACVSVSCLPWYPRAQRQPERSIVTFTSTRPCLDWQGGRIRWWDVGVDCLGCWCMLQCIFLVHIIYLLTFFSALFPGETWCSHGFYSVCTLLHGVWWQCNCWAVIRDER